MDPPPAVIGRTMADDLFGEETPLGRRLRMDSREEVQIVGVVEDARYGDLRAPPRWTVYTFDPRPIRPPARFAVRADGDPAAVIPMIENAVRETDGAFQAVNIQTLREINEATLARERFLAQLVGGFALLALLLAAVGVYGLFAYRVRRQRNEIAVRMALGAKTGDVVRLLGGEMLVILTGGCLIGLAAAWGLTRWVSSLLFGLSPADPWTLSMATTTLVLTALLAGLIPARKASRVNPAQALRTE